MKSLISASILLMLILCISYKVIHAQVLGIDVFIDVKEELGTCSI